MTKKINLSEYNEENIQESTDSTCIGIIVADWNSEITEALYQGAVETLEKHGISKEMIIRKDVPGSFELPLAAQYLSGYAMVDAVICLGCVIQGETRHFEFISNAVAQGIMQVGLSNEIPVVFGVLTTDTLEQAKERSGGKHGNKGVEAAQTALRMLSLFDEMIDMMEDDLDYWDWDEDDMEDDIDLED